MTPAPTLSIWRGVAMRRPVPVACPALAKRPPDRVYLIMEEVAKKHGFVVDDLRGAVRTKPLSRARFEAMARVRSEITIAGVDPSMPLIGAWFGGRDHTTVLNALRRHAEITSEAA